MALGGWSSYDANEPQLAAPTEENIIQLKNELVKFTNDRDFKKANNMGQILKTALAFVKRNYLEYDKH